MKSFNEYFIGKQKNVIKEFDQVAISKFKRSVNFIKGETAAHNKRVVSDTNTQEQERKTTLRKRDIGDKVSDRQQNNTERTRMQAPPIKPQGLQVAPKKVQAPPIKYNKKR